MQHHSQFFKDILKKFFSKLKMQGISELFKCLFLPFSFFALCAMPSRSEGDFPDPSLTLHR